MAKRNIGKEIIAGLEEIKAWRRDDVKLRTFTVDLPRAVDVPAIRKSLGSVPEAFKSVAPNPKKRKVSKSASSSYVARLQKTA